MVSDLDRVDFQDLLRGQLRFLRGESAGTTAGRTRELAEFGRRPSTRIDLVADLERAGHTHQDALVPARLRPRPARGRVGSRSPNRRSRGTVTFRGRLERVADAVASHHPFAHVVRSVAVGVRCERLQLARAYEPGTTCAA